ncbi:MAG: efflux RND transporter permease subunit, partial [Leptospirales bacterium]
RLAAHQLSLTELEDAISSSNINYPAGHIPMGGMDVLIRTIGEYARIDDIGRTIVSRGESGVPIRLADMARITDGYRERTGVARYNGKECVIVSVYKEAGKNTVEVADRIKGEFKQIRETFGQQADMALVYDESLFVRNSIDSLIQDLIVGGALAFCALILILRNTSSPLILLTVLPISIITTFLFMHLQGLSLNMMTLGGLTMGIGILFDAGNVVLAAIERYIGRGLSPRDAALRGASEVSGSVTSAVLTTIIIFLPIIFLEGVVGVVFGEMALTVTYSNAVSLVVALTLIPMLSSLRRNPEGDAAGPWGIFESLFFRRVAALELRLDDAYRNRLAKALERPAPIYAAVVAALIGAVGLLFFVERESTPPVDNGIFEISIKNVKGSSLESTAEAVRLVEDTLAREPNVEHVIARIGFDEDELMARKGGDVGTHQATIRVVLQDERETPTREVVAQLRERIQIREDIRIDIHMSEDVLGSLLSPDARAVTLELSGDDLEVLREIGNRVTGDLSKISGLTDVKASMQEESREIHVRFDESRMAIFDLSHDYLAQYFRTAIKGSVVTRLRVADEEINVRLRLRESDRRSRNDLDRLLVKSSEGKSVYISSFATIEEEMGFTSVLRSGQSRINRITGELAAGGTRNDVFAGVEDYITRVKLPPGYNINFAGEKEEIEKNFRELMFAFLLAALLIYMVLAAQFESLKLPLVMLVTIPLVMIGITPALLVTGKSLNISSFTGIILLVGIVVDNAALFYEYVEILQEEGKSLRDAVLDSGAVVLRPILMNNGTTLLGLLPIALELGQGTEFQSPMAIAVISGLLTSVFLSLFLIPMLFYAILRKKQRESESNLRHFPQAVARE